MNDGDGVTPGDLLHWEILGWGCWLGNAARLGLEAGSITVGVWNAGLPKYPFYKNANNEVTDNPGRKE